MGDEAADVGRQVALEGGDDGRKNAFDPRCGHDLISPGNGAPFLQRSAGDVQWQCRNPSRRRHGRHPDRPGPAQGRPQRRRRARRRRVRHHRGRRRPWPTSAMPPIRWRWPEPRASASARSRSVIPHLLAPIDLQAIKAAGVTFAVSLLERLIEEQTKGDLSRAEHGAQGAELDHRRRRHHHQARLARGRGAEEDPDGARRLVALSRGRHRPLCRDLHQGAADGGRRLRRGDRHPLGLRLEQSRARGDAGRQRQGHDRRRDARQRRQPARHGGPQRPAAGHRQGQQRLLRDRPLRAPVRRRPSRSTTCARPRSSSKSPAPTSSACAARATCRRSAATRPTSCTTPWATRISIPTAWC